MSFNKTVHRNIIRTHMRTFRRALTLQERYIAAQLITNKIIATNQIFKSKHIAIFISCDGEINTTLLIRTLLFMNKKIYLPVLPQSKSQPLLFAQYTLSTPLIHRKNMAFNNNIYEPQWNIRSIIPIEYLNTIFVPLVAFDNYGNRLGMGGGFYDKTLQFWKNQTNYIPIGLAYDFQKTNDTTLPTEPWDIPLPTIITPSYLCGSRI